jgi:hypothetical protein
MQEYMGYVNHPNVFPMSYTVVEAYVKTVFNKMVDRNLDIVCTLRGSNSDPTRLRYGYYELEDEFIKSVF